MFEGYCQQKRISTYMHNVLTWLYTYIPSPEGQPKESLASHSHNFEFIVF